MTTAGNLSLEIRYQMLQAWHFPESNLQFFLYYFLGRFERQFYRRIYLFFFSEFLVIQMFVKIQFLLYIFQKSNCMSLRDPHFANLDRLYRICGNLLGKKTLAKEKDITRQKVYFLSISLKICSTTTSQDMHEILSSYEYGLQEKYKAPYLT